MSDNKNYAQIRIGLASPETIRGWSHGEVTKPETINYRTLRPEKDGLFCEKIFGPTKDWECLCGKYKRARVTRNGKELVCEKCGVAVTSKKVRRARMGSIELASPVSHIWYFRAIPSRMSILLDITPKQLEKVLYFANRVILNDLDNRTHDFVLKTGKELAKGVVVTENEYLEAQEKYGDMIEYGMGAEAIKKLLQEIDLDKLAAELRASINGDDLQNKKAASGQKKVKLIKRLEVVEAFRLSGNRPEWMILDVIPVIPPELRPMVQLDGGRFATSDLNDLYRRVINRNNRLKKMIEQNAPEIVIKSEKRMLQEAVDALIDNGRRSKPVTGGSSNRPLKSLSEMLRGKQGRFRQNLLGKRVDYSGRSVIVVGPELRIYQCGLPKEMALELFKPYVTKRLVETQDAKNVRDAKKKIEHSDPVVYDALEVVIKDHPVMLNRAPTLHRLSIEAFEPVLVEGRAIKLHPLVCSPFNADFDGDQMSVHVPLSNEAQAEARFLMLSANNFLKPADGKAVNMPSQDMVMGSYWLTIDKADEPGENGLYRDFNEAMMAYSVGDLGLHAPIKVRVEKFVAKLKDSDSYVVLGETEAEVKRAFDEGIYDETTLTKRSAIIDATLGRYIFNQSVPQDLGFVNRVIDEKNPKAAFELEIDDHKSTGGKSMVPAKKKVLGEIIDRTIKKHDIAVTADVLDNIKANGFKYSTKGAISISISDVTVPEEKWQIIKETEEKVQEIADNYDMGLLSEDERYSSVVKAWADATDQVTEVVMSHLGKYNPINMMADSGARGSSDQIHQLAGMRGLMVSATGRTMEIPVKSNFREGQTVLEYFSGARGSRKKLSDTALKTADSGYLTRRLVDVSQEVIVTEEDCGAKEGIWIHDLKNLDGSVVEALSERLPGRYAVEDIVDPTTGEVYVKANTLISSANAKRIVDAGITDVHIRSILKCKAKHGICSHCYGSDLASTQDRTIAVGEAVGIIAAQSIGEPGTQLTMRTFHSGGIAGSDITQGLPRIEELFEARTPKKAAIMADVAGTFKSVDQKRIKELIITTDENVNRVNTVPLGTKVIVQQGQHVDIGDILTEGSLILDDIIKVHEKEDDKNAGLGLLYDYIIREVQHVYRLQGIKNNDKHIEVIARQMTRKTTVVDPGSTDLLEGTVVDVTLLDSKNEEIENRIKAGEQGLKYAKGRVKILGITKAAIQTDSFLSAASFQETTRVLTDAAIKGKIDKLTGLKENVIIGKLIPAGTGLVAYRDVEVKKENEDDDIEEEPNKFAPLVSLDEEDDDMEEEAEEDVEVDE